MEKGPGYVYYKATPKVDEYLLENFKNLHASKTEKAQKPATEAAPTAAPETTLNVNLKVTWDINLNFNGLKDLFK